MPLMSSLVGKGPILAVQIRKSCRIVVNLSDEHCTSIMRRWHLQDQHTMKST
jgi:hypothetical protein